MSLKKSITPLVKIAFGILLTGATLLLITAVSDILPTQAVTIAFILLFGGAGILSFFWKPRAIPQEREVMLYTCAKCHRQLAKSDVYVMEGKNVPENHRCKECYLKDNTKEAKS